MRSYGRIHTSFWTDDRIQATSDRAKLLASYLLSGPHSNSIGCFRLPVGYVMADLGWSEKAVGDAFQELAWFCVRDDAGWTLIRNFLKHNPPENPNVAKAMMKLVKTVPQRSPEIWNGLCDALSEIQDQIPEPVPNRIETVSDSVRIPEPNLTLPEPEPEPEPEPDARARGRSGSEQFAAFWEAYPEKTGKGAAETAFRKAIGKTDLPTMLEGLRRYIACKPPDRNWCNPSTWLNQQRWLDEPALPTVRPDDHGLGNRPLPRDTLQWTDAERRGLFADVYRDKLAERAEREFDA